MKEPIITTEAPQAIGPYSQAISVSCSNMIFCSGQIPLDPSSGEIVGQTTAEQCEQVLKNLRAVLAAAGAGMDHIVKTTVYLKDMNDFAAINEVYAGFFKGNPPARAAVEVSRLPKDVRIEIEAIAMI